MAKRILLLGATGVLGQALEPRLKEVGHCVLSPSRENLDLLNFGEVERFIKENALDALVNCAAQSKVEKAVEIPAETYRLNSELPALLARVTKDTNTPFIHISTDYVFDGHKGKPYLEQDATGEPLNIYGKSKLAGEWLAMAVNPEASVLRVAALFGPSSRMGFIDWVLTNAKIEEPLRIIAERYISPSYTVDIANQLLQLLDEHLAGIIHCTGEGSCSWYELAKEALLLAGKPTESVIPVDDSQLTSPAIRPNYTVLENSRLKEANLNQMKPWEEGLARYIKETRR